MAVMKTGNERDLNLKNSHDSPWSNGSGEPGVAVDNTQIQDKFKTTVLMKRMYIVKKEM